MRKYPCSLDTLAKYLPWLLLLTGAFIVGKIFMHEKELQEHFLMLSALVPAIIIGILVFVLYLMHTIDVTVTDTTLTIERKIGPKRILFADVLSVKRVANMRFAFRTMGNGGVFGYTGIYYKRGIGKMTWYCTQRKNYVLIEMTSGKKIVITPDDPEGLMNDIEKSNPLLVIRPGNN